MDIRCRQLRLSEDNECSRSVPTSGTMFRCLDRGSSESISSIGIRSPKLGKYRRLPNTSECDVCKTAAKDVTNLKCLHAFCSKCIDRHGIVKNGCPVCNNLCDKFDVMGRNTQEKYSPEKEAYINFTDDFIFSLDEEQHNGSQDESLDDSLNTMENRILKHVEARYHKIRQDIGKLDSEAEIEIGKIRDHVERVKKMIDKRADAMIKNIYESKTRHVREFSRQEKFIQERIEHMKLTIKRCRENLENFLSLTDETYREMHLSVKELIKLSDQLAEENVHIRFHVRPLTDAILENVIGKVGVRVFLAKSLQVTLCNTIDFPGGVHSICPVDNTRAWIGYQNFIQLCSKDGKKGPQIDVGEEVHDLARDSKGNILIACQTCVKLLDSDNKMFKLFSCGTTPQGIACRTDGFIVTCLGKELAICGPTGEQVSKIKHNQSEIKMPFKVAINVNGDICVSDYQSSAGEVAIFDSDGLLKAKLRTDGMAPRGVACNSQGMIYVGDFRTDRVNVYSTHGHFLQTAIQGDGKGLSGPLSVSIDKTGDLWVGDWKRKVRIYNQKISDSCDDIE